MILFKKKDSEKVTLSRRSFVAATMLSPAFAKAQNLRPVVATPPSVVSEPPRQWGSQSPPDIFPDPDVLTIDNSFNRFIVRYSAIKRLSTGYRWTEGAAWCGEGRFVVFSDVQGDTQYRYIWETGEITPYRKPSFNSNGNSFDFQGRQISCQHFFRRVVRWELDGSMSVIADSFGGKPLNSPNDLAPHPDGSIWFTDPAAGDSLSEGHPDIAGAAQNPHGLYNPALGDSGVGQMGSYRRELPAQTYRWDPSGRVDIVMSNKDIPSPNGICFSPDYKKVYIISGGIHVADVTGSKATNLRNFTDCMVEGIYCHPDGMRADRAGNIWSSSNALLGYSGVTVWNPDGKLIGRIRLPEAAANLCFAGPKRNYLFICASQSVYMLGVNIQGAAPG